MHPSSSDKIDETVIAIVNVYSPNKNCPKFYEKLAVQLESFSEHKIIMGDFNVTLNEQIDRYNSKTNSVTYVSKVATRHALQSLIDDYILTDIWRERNPNKTTFSWHKQCLGLLASRIDFSLVSKGFSNCITNITYIPAFKTDHSACHLTVEINKNKRGAGYWKLNCSLLENKDFLDIIGTTIENSLTSNADLNPISKWEKLNSDVVKTAINFSRRNQSEKRLVISQLLEIVGDLEENLPLPEEQDLLLVKTKLDLESLIEENTKGIIFRSRVQWTEYGGKNSKYFFNLEKSRYNAKTCSLLIGENNQEHTEDDDILKLLREYYANFYSSDQRVSFDIENEFNVHVNDEQQKLQSLPITPAELANAIKTMKNNKTPGSDGLSRILQSILQPIKGTTVRSL